VSFAPLQSSCFKCPDRWFPTLSLGIRPGCAFRRRHRCRSVGRQPYLSAPPSTCSPASTPAQALLPSLRSRSATFAIPFRPHRFARSRRFSPPIAPFARSFAPLLAQDSRACCIPLPILGFVAFLSSFGWSHLPTLAVSGRCADGHANAASPQRASYPSEDSPHPQPFRVSTTVASLVFASREVSIDPSSPLPALTCVSRLHDAPPSRRCSADESVPVPAVSSEPPAYPPWALFPFEVLRPRDCSRGGCVAHSVRRHPGERNPCSFAAALVAPVGRNRWVKEPRSVPPGLLLRTRPALGLGNLAPAMVAGGSSRSSAVRRGIGP
jgi:hypothetical protein